MTHCCSRWWWGLPADPSVQGAPCSLAHLCPAGLVLSSHATCGLAPAPLYPDRPERCTGTHINSITTVIVLFSLTQRWVSFTLLWFLYSKTRLKGAFKVTSIPHYLCECALFLKNSFLPYYAGFSHFVLAPTSAPRPP